MKQIKSYKELKAYRQELEDKRDLQKLALLKRADSFSRPLEVASFVAKPLLSRISWLSVGMSAFKLGRSLFRRKRR